MQGMGVFLGDGGVWGGGLGKSLGFGRAPLPPQKGGKLIRMGGTRGPTFSQKICGGTPRGGGGQKSFFFFGQLIGGNPPGGPHFLGAPGAGWGKSVLFLTVTNLKGPKTGWGGGNHPGPGFRGKKSRGFLWGGKKGRGGKKKKPPGGAIYWGGGLSGGFCGKKG